MGDDEKKNAVPMAMEGNGEIILLNPSESSRWYSSTFELLPGGIANVQSCLDSSTAWVPDFAQFDSPQVLKMLFYSHFVFFYRLNMLFYNLVFLCFCIAHDDRPGARF